MHVQRLVWIVADDTESCNPLIDNLLSRMGKRAIIVKRFLTNRAIRRNPICASIIPHALPIQISKDHPARRVEPACRVKLDQEQQHQGWRIVLR